MEPDVRKGFLQLPGEGHSVWVTDELTRIIITGEETGGTYSIIESHVPPGGGPPPHIHHREDEGFWILEGELQVMLDGQWHTAGPGAFVHLPKNVPHTFRSVGPVPARFLNVMVPAGLEMFFVELGTPGDDISSPPPVTQEDIDRLIALAPTYGLHILVPDGSDT